MKLRRIFVWLLVPVLVLFLLLGLLISPLGTPVLRYTAETLVDGLSIEDINGTILSDFSVSGLSWQNSQWQVNAKYIEINAVLRCFIAEKICIDHLELNHIEVTQKFASDATEQSDDSVADINLPIPVILNALSVTDFSLTLPEQTISISSLSVQGSADTKIHLDPLTVNGLTVHLAAAATTPEPSASSTSYAMDYQAPELPVIRLPIPVSINNFSVSPVTIIQGDNAPIDIARVEWDKLDFVESQLNWRKLHVEHSQLQLDTTGGIVFAERYPLDVAAQLAVTQGEIQEDISLNAEGALDDMTFNVETQGTYTVLAQGQGNVLTDRLPLDFKMTWPEQDIPQIEGGTLWKGALSFQGEMGQYHLTGEAGANLPDIGPIPVSADVVLKRENISVNALTIAILEGQITNTGTLFLDETMSWSGQTTVAGISTQSLSQMGPENINGGFTSLMQLTKEGAEMSITDLSVTGQRDGSPINVDGALVYSQRSDLLVSNLNVAQQENQISIAAQIINQRYLNADIHLDVDDIEQLYPNVTGAVNGRIRASGEWTNPTANGAIKVSNVQVSPALNPTLAEQGAANGVMEITGSLDNHQLQIKMATPENAIQLALSGGWQNGQYNGQISDTELGLLTTRWQLIAPFGFTYTADPAEVTVNENCWQTREQGKLCLEQTLYQNNLVQWAVNGQTLPLGIWAHEFLANTITAPSDATLSFTSTGKVGADAPLSATFDMTVSPSTWTLGPQQQLALTTDNFSVKGDYTGNDLVADLSLSSEQLGQVSAHVNATPTDVNAPISGNLQLTDISIAPFKPMSASIRTLSGVLNGQLALSGSLDSVQLNGDIALAQGNIDVESMPVKINDWEQQIHLTGQSGAFDGSFLLGDGAGTINGDFRWHDGLEANIHLDGERFEIQQPDIRMQVSPNLTANIQPNKVTVNGSVNIPWARILVENLPANAVSPSKDVHLRGEPPTEDPLDIVDANVMVNIDKAESGEVKLDAFGLTANLYGGIEVRTQPALVGYGDLQILDGRYQAYGQDLIIETGEVQFNGPLDQPMLLVEAIRDPDQTEDNVVAGVRIEGAADNPNINLFSEPSMNQSNSLSYLLTGSGPGSSSSEPDYNALLLGFGLSSTEKLQGQLGDALGIDDFSVGTTSSVGSSSTKLSINGKINDRLTVQYNLDVGLSSNDSSTSTLRQRQEPPDVSLRYRLLPKLFVEAVQTTIDEQTEFALDFYYEFFLGEPAPSRVEENQDN
ncbi:translocation/assembly module TamB domain-containing protein [Alteromonas sp. C1M14]|uniref:translocation/assembly module TamB domain-containing protein n=1 Tax=Alteromonas sp. C1M14 TaxID=2841567 RepID=UPI001C08AB8C|nr:translocation/assembly module TamB domain-containing protein [Alteromonas sp. C1M14]MBU2978392.1 translocation/assembly module TamB domain-containing protein [Alteromonas sp. C1M14]